MLATLLPHFSICKCMRKCYFCFNRIFKFASTSRVKICTYTHTQTLIIFVFALETSIQKPYTHKKYYESYMHVCVHVFVTATFCLCVGVIFQIAFPFFIISFGFL